MTEAVAAVAGPGTEASWLRQVHSDRAVEARAGESGRADALWTRRRALALVVSTADCVPVLLAGDGLVAAGHAGWRGLTRGLLPGLIERLPGPPGGLMAWIGPAVGACCYEVGEEVAARVAGASGPEIVLPRPGGRPHLDLAAAAKRQLLTAGVCRIEVVAACTRCDGERLASYRRDGDRAGRNLAIAWLRPANERRPGPRPAPS